MSTHDVDLYGSTGNTFVANSHVQPSNHAAEGQAFREDTGCNDNFVDADTIDTTVGDYYFPTLSVVKAANTLGANNRPRSRLASPAIA